ncbi:hypothetical protein BDY19DRAFT_110427 [Irpex rosettiformis]|uniref:Uncharacterized protein n=1 Tax=Irpex rosettiformis TaxID=378272 RepID=A0ACB8U5Z4_9APHY|nr:hypothetical protein BDY19DRAFT_110427 [Irpex rosettiformis]
MYPTPQQAYYNAHPQFPYPANQYPTQATFASQQVSALHRSTTPPAPSYAAQSQYTYAGCHSTSTNDSQLIQGSSSSSSLACALDERVSPRHSGGGGESGSPAQPGFPDNEVVPYAPSPSVSTPYGSASPPDYCGSVDTEDESLDEFSQSLDSDVQFSDLIQDEEGIAAASSSNYDEQSAASSYGSTVDPMSPPNTEYETDTEVGYFNGQMVPLGLVGEYASVSRTTPFCHYLFLMLRLEERISFEPTRVSTNRLQCSGTPCGINTWCAR